MNWTRLVRLFCIVALSLCIGVVAEVKTFTYAQQAITASDFFFDTIPENPKPLQSVTVRLQTYAADLDTATITWNYNGRTVQSGVGEKEITVTMGPSGTRSTLEAVISTSGTVVRIATVLQANAVDMIWEAPDGYTPPFYKGKTLPAGGARITVTALTALPQARNLVYTWSHNDTIESRASGAGKNSFTFMHNEINPTETVTVTTRNSSTTTGSGAARITPITPSVLVYERRGGFIHYTNAYTDTFTMNYPGTTLRIEPYYFSTPRSLEEDLTFDIALGGQPVEMTNTNELQLSRPEVRGQQLLSLNVEKINTILQVVNKTLLINF